MEVISKEMIIEAMGANVIIEGKRVEREDKRTQAKALKSTNI